MCVLGTPSAPRNVLLKVMDQTNIVVTWDRPEDDGHLELLEYSVINYDNIIFVVLYINSLRALFHHCNGLALYGRLVRLVRSKSVWHSGVDAGVIRSISSVRFPSRQLFSFSAH